MGIHYLETFEIITPESAEFGEPEESGFISEEPQWDEFRNIVDMLAGTEPSEYPLSDNPGKRVWFTHYDFDIDYSTGARESRSFHPVTDRDAHYMVKAWRVANGATVLEY